MSGTNRKESRGAALLSFLLGNVYGASSPTHG